MRCRRTTIRSAPRWGACSRLPPTPSPRSGEVWPFPRCCCRGITARSSSGAGSVRWSGPAAAGRTCSARSESEPRFLNLRVDMAPSRGCPAAAFAARCPHTSPVVVVTVSIEAACAHPRGWPGPEGSRVTMNTLQTLDAESLRSDIPDFRAGDTLKVHVRVIEGNRSRVQIFQGVTIRRQGGGLQETFTVRKISFGVGVERTFPLHSPSIGKLEVVSRGHVRRAKLYYLRERRGKKARIRERRLGDEELAVIAAAEAQRAAAGSAAADDGSAGGAGDEVGPSETTDAGAEAADAESDAV